MATALLSSALARAQQATPAAPDSPVSLDRFIVTGSNIPTTEVAIEAGAFPVLQIDRKAIEESSYQSAGELIQKLSLANGGGVPTSNNAAGATPSASAVSIHGMGPDATLVLINGHRVANYPLGENATEAFVDLNTIPLAAVERIELLKDGASAIYGADAVAGVVNIILRQNYSGSLVSFNYGNTTEKDSGEYGASVLTGFRTDRSSLNVIFSYNQRAAIFQRDRSYSATPPGLSTNSSPINAQITLAAYDEAVGLPAGTPPPGLNGATFFATPGVTPGAPGGNSLPADGNAVANSTNYGNTPASEYIYVGPRRAPSRYNYNQEASSYPDLTRYGVIASGEHQFQSAPQLTAYFDFSEQVNKEVNTLAPTATGSFTSFGNTELVIPARTPNPLPLPDGRDRAAAAGAYNPFNPFNLDITGNTHFRLADFGPRIFDDTNKAFLATAGVRADNFLGTWSADAGVRYSQVTDDTANTVVSISRFNQVLNQADPIFDPASPTYIGTTSAYNPFGYYTNPIPANQKVVAYATVHTRDHYASQLGNAFLTVNNPSLCMIPAGDIGVAAGLDYRREVLIQEPDFFETTGDVMGGSVNSPTNSSRSVAAAYAEVKLPVIGRAQGIPGFHDLSLDLAVRMEDFVTSHEINTVGKVGLHWAPWGDTFALRASYGTGIRQPSLYELFISPQPSYSNYIDPRDNSDIFDVTSIINKNEALKSETTTSASAGFVWTPKGSLRGFTIAADLWRVERNNTVGVDLQNTLDRFYGTAPGGPRPGEQVILDQDGNINEVIGLYLNFGKTVAEGLDISSSYVLPTKSLGRFDFNVMASYLYSIEFAQLPGLPSVEFVDQATDSNSSDGYLRWKGNVGVDWSYQGLGVHVAGNFTDGFQDYDAEGDPRRVASTWSYDARISYDFKGRFLPYSKGLKLVVGGRNLGNLIPPVAYGGGGNSTGYPGALYNSEGRFIYTSLEKKF